MISGDKSKYKIFQDFIRIFEYDQVFLSNEIINLLSESETISTFKLIDLFALGSKHFNFGRCLVIERLIKLALGVSSLLKIASLVLSVSLLVLELGLNLLIGFLKFGYYKNAV